VVTVQGRGDAGTITLRTRYPDGKWWWVIVIYELRGDRIVRATHVLCRGDAAHELGRERRRRPLTLGLSGAARTFW
jgi:hypothetical protein